MSQGTSSRILAILAVAIVALAGLGLLLALMGREPGAPTSVIPTPPDDPVVANVVFDQSSRSIRYSFWQETVLLDYVMSELVGQPVPTPDKTLQRLINEELVLLAVPPEQTPAAMEIETRIDALEQAWGVDDAVVVAALEQVGLTRAAFERSVGRLLRVQASLDILRGQGKDITSWLKEQRTSAEIRIFEDVAAPALPVAQAPVATGVTSPISTPVVETLVPSPTPVPATEIPPLTPALAIPEVAPDFTLERARGGSFTLTEQLTQGPVVLTFFQRGGG